MSAETIQRFLLSPQQEHVWQLQQRDGDAAFVARCAASLQGNLEVGSLRAALAGTVVRHEILRTTLHRFPGLAAPVQVVEPVGSLRTRERCLVPCLVVDLEALAPRLRKAEVERLLAGDRPFDLEQGPLLRVCLVQRGEDGPLLLLTASACCADASSLVRIVRELARGCALAGAAGGEEPLQYAAVAGWLSELLLSHEAQAGRRYWKRTLAESQPLTGLPFEDPAGVESAFRPRHVARVLAGAERWERGAAALGVSLEALLLAGWQSLLSRITEQREFLIGVSFDGVTDDLEESLGPLARTLPVPARLAPDRPFAEALAQAAAALGSGREWQECFAWKDMADGPMGLPGLPVGFELRKMPQGEPAGPLAFSVEDLYACSDRFTIRLACLCRAREIELRLDYDPAVLPGSWVARIGEQLETLLESALRHPEAPLRDLDLMSDAERRELVLELNRTATGDSGPAGLHEMFELQAERTPDLMAVRCGDRRWSYRELNARANRLAHRLRRLGVGAEQRVGICLERSPEMVMAVLGTLKAGAAYLPLDPDYPPERLAFMLADARPVVLLTQRSLAAGFPAYPPDGPRVLCLDQDDEAADTAPEAEEGRDLGSRTMAGQLAYVIYTSGSTGRPKGVMVPHGAICNQISWSAHRLPLGETDIVLQKTSIGFDASVWELFAPLAAGALLALAEPEGHRDTAYLARACREQEVTVLQGVPSLLRVLLREPAFAGCGRLRRILSAGEALSRDLAEELQERFDVELVNLYGPTEAAINVLFHVCGRPLPAAPVPLGRPLANTRIYVLDSTLRPAATGLPGELYLGGAGLARGYLGRPDLTAAQLIPDPLGGTPGERLYRTGDLVRFRPDGSLEFLGRIDHQVKVRGQRIELGEIEALLEQHPGLLQAVVVAREDETLGLHLVAYAVPAGQPAPGPLELRSWLQRRLPEGMMPAAFVFLDALPRLPNGKVDRSSLPAPGKTVPRDDSMLPRTPTEELVAQIWSEVLGIDAIGCHDDFFALGGHSLLATQVITRVREALQIELPLRTIFASPTVAETAERIDALRSGRTAARPLQLARAPRPEKLSLSFAQQRLWSVQQLEPGSSAYNVHLPVRLLGHLRIEALAGALAEIVSRHEALRTTFVVEDGEPFQRILPRLALDLPVVDLRALGPDRRRLETERLAIEEARLPFDLEHGPLVRSRLVRLDEDENVLLLTMHHIVSDGWSLGVLSAEVGALYESIVEGRPSFLPELPVQYADFAQWQRSWLQGEVLARQLDFWRDYLQGAPAFLDLPTDHPRPGKAGHRGERQSFLLSPELSEGIRALCRHEGLTPFMALLAALKGLLYLYSGQTDVVVGSPIANRTLTETEKLIGFFVNTLVLRTRLAGEMSFRELLARVRESVLDASAHQDLPFEKLLEELRPERHPGRTPFFQVVFTFQNAPLPGIEQPHLELSFLEIHNGTAKFDLTFNAWETGQGLAGSIEHRCDLFESATVRKMWRHFERLLSGIVVDPEARLDSLEIFSQEENALFAREVAVGELEAEFQI